jgi:hypothetical protein
MYEEWTGRRPTAAQNSEQPEYRTPFVRFVHAFAPLAGVASDLAPKSIRAALSSRLPQKKCAIGPNDGASDPCHPSSDNVGQTGSHDHES